MSPATPDGSTMEPHGPRSSTSCWLMVGLSMPKASFRAPTACAKLGTQVYGNGQQRGSARGDGTRAHEVEHAVRDDGREGDVAQDLVREQQRRLAQAEGAAQQAVARDGQHQQADEHVAVVARQARGRQLHHAGHAARRLRPRLVEVPLHGPPVRRHGHGQPRDPHRERGAAHADALVEERHRPAHEVGAADGPRRGAAGAQRERHGGAGDDDIEGGHVQAGREGVEGLDAEPAVAGREGEADGQAEGEAENKGKEEKNDAVLHDGRIGKYTARWAATYNQPAWTGRQRTGGPRQSLKA